MKDDGCFSLEVITHISQDPERDNDRRYCTLCDDVEIKIEPQILTTARKINQTMGQAMVRF